MELAKPKCAKKGSAVRLTCEVSTEVVDGASIVADVWLNGQKLGQHRGAFTRFRFDVTGKLKLGKKPKHGRYKLAIAISQPSRFGTQTVTLKL